MREGRVSQNRGTTLRNHWKILKLLACDEQTVESIASVLRLSTKTIRRHISAMEKDIGFQMIVRRSSTRFTKTTYVYSLPIRMCKLVQELFANRDVSGIENDDSVCGHNTLHGENIPGCKGCTQTLRDYEEELRETQRVSPKQRRNGIHVQAR